MFCNDHSVEKAVMGNWITADVVAFIEILCSRWESKCSICVWFFSSRLLLTYSKPLCLP